MVTDFDRSKSLQQLEDADWGEPTYDSHLVTRVHRLRQKPLNEFSVEDFRIVIGQEIGLPFLVPLAVDQLEHNPLAAGDLHDGGLLDVVLRVGESFWANHPDLFQRMCDVLIRLKNTRSILDETERRMVQKVLERSSPAFKHLFFC